MEGNRIETNTINNATWQAVLPNNKHGWFCLQCSMYMKLYPISHDLPPTHWHCGTCKKNVRMSERNAVFDTTIQIAKEKCDLKTLEYSKDDRTWTIVSSEFIGDSRISSKRKPIKKTEREHIIDTIREAIMEELHISFEDFQQFFNTE